jgi:hypothetical protein
LKSLFYTLHFFQALSIGRQAHPSRGD